MQVEEYYTKIIFKPKAGPEIEYVCPIQRTDSGFYIDTSQLPNCCLGDRISVEGEPWGTCNFRSWQEVIEHLKPYAKKEEPTPNTDEHDKEALRLLKLFSQNVNGMIECMEGGDAYNPGAIGGIIDIDVFLQVRDELVKSRIEDDDGKVDSNPSNSVA